MIKYFFLFLSLTYFKFSIFSQAICNCIEPTKYESPILSSLQEIEMKDSLSYKFLTNFLENNINKDSISERFYNNLIFEVGEDGQICNLSYRYPISKEAQFYIKKSLTPLYSLVFSHTCFKFLLALTIDDIISVSDSVFRIAKYSPILSGCSHSLSSEELKACMLTQIEKCIWRHPLYPKLNINSTVIVEFVITKTGELTLLKIKRNYCDATILKEILSSVKWEPGKNSKGESLNVTFIMPLKPMY